MADPLYDAPEATAAADPERWVERHADALYRFALARVRRPEVAEDLVQETLVAAWRARGGFAGRANERTWLTAILKRKLIDWLRGTLAERASRDGRGVDGWLAAEFTPAGTWREKPSAWGPQAAERAEFWAVVRECAGKMPLRLHDAFVLWHLEELDGERVCAAVGVTPNHLGVVLFRARHRMWKCLSKHWFGIEPEGRAESWS